MSSQTTKIANTTVNKASQAVSNAKNAIVEVASSDKGPLIIVICISVLLLLFVILYITFAMKSSSLQGKQLTNEPIRLDKVDAPIQIANGDMPPSKVGREYSFAFWLYVDNFEQLVDTTSNAPIQRLIFYRGNANDVTSANPVVMMDGKSNTLYFAVKTQGTSLDVGSNAKLYNIIKNNYFLNPTITTTDPLMNKYIIIPVDYVPLQRWVHLTLCVDNKVMTIYMDGEIYSVKSVDEFKSYRPPEIDSMGKTIDTNLIVDRTDGDLFIGKNGAVGNKVSVNGYVGRVEFFNYAVPMDDVKKSYNKGPIPGGVLSWLGINNYGFRAPIYKLDEK